MSFTAHYNQIGYETRGFKTVIIESDQPDGEAIACRLCNSKNQPVVEQEARFCGAVPGWKNRHFWLFDFSVVTVEGHYSVDVCRGSHRVQLFPILIQSHLHFNATAAVMVSYFTAMRCMRDDSAIACFGKPDTILDVCGGWEDASGDSGKYLTHLSYAHFFNPQQTPLIIWALLKSYELVPDGFSESAPGVPAILEEAAWGADYLLRIFDKEGFFYMNVFDQWGYGVRELCSYRDHSGQKVEDYHAAFRQGGGLSVAALAKAASMGVSGQMNPGVYLAVAIRAFDHLKSKNLSYCGNNEENIIDDYCGLLAAVELFKATNQERFRDDAAMRAESLMLRMAENGSFTADDGLLRPFYHGVEEGLPMLALCEYLSIDPRKKTTVIATLSRALHFYQTITQETVNPFLYARQVNRPWKNGSYGPMQHTFFMPHDNETGYWWQGENGRIASLAAACCAAGIAVRQYTGKSTEETQKIVVSQLDWIMGKNPFDVCMLYRMGAHSYPDLTGHPDFCKGAIHGGICNGITAATNDEADIEWMAGNPADAREEIMWRWAEQWLPHNGWFLLAVSYLRKALQ
ncbi:MAG: glycoside hydrolase family 9 protein [Chitinivibrionales bacterium]|nr:glycoside hydrolase family 9 protein [Chitinivibrionales bacterium]